MGKITSYQKLKAENAKLIEEIKTLVFKPDSLKALNVKNLYRLKYEFGHVFDAFEWKKRTDVEYGKGILWQIKETTPSPLGGNKLTVRKFLNFLKTFKYE